MLRGFLRAKDWLKKKARKDDLPNLNAELDVDELRNAEVAIVRAIQEADYAKEMKTLRGGPGGVKMKGSSLYGLDPMLSEEGVITVGGRMRYSRIPSQSKHPAILPKNHPVLNAIICDAHQETLHGGREHIVSVIRSRFWVVSLRPAVRRYLQRCFVCRRRDAKAREQKMADLPECRVHHGKPAFHTSALTCLFLSS